MVQVDKIDVGTGAIDINIPKGMKEGTIFNVPGKAFSKIQLSLGFIRVRLPNHREFGRDGLSLIGAIEIDYLVLY